MKKEYPNSYYKRYRKEAKFSPIQDDINKVEHSYSFRQLAGKSQVVSPYSYPGIATTRMTHSYAVANIARKLTIDGGLTKEDNDLAYVGGLLHDIGHPPFGHMGERVLNELCDDGFQANAQNLRVIFRDLNLTKLSVTSSMKYPWTRNVNEEHYGIYMEDYKFYQWATDYKCNSAYGVKTHIAHIVDTADDIAYSVHDFFDAVKLGFVTKIDASCKLSDLGLHVFDQDKVYDAILKYNYQRRNEIVGSLQLYARDKVRGTHRMMRERANQREIIEGLWHYLRPPRSSDRETADFIAQMTDEEATVSYHRLRRGQRRQPQ